MEMRDFIIEYSKNKARKRKSAEKIFKIKLTSFIEKLNDNLITRKLLTKSMLD